MCSQKYWRLDCWYLSEKTWFIDSKKKNEIYIHISARAHSSLTCETCLFQPQSNIPMQLSRFSSNQWWSWTNRNLGKGCIPVSHTPFHTPISTSEGTHGFNPVCPPYSSSQFPYFLVPLLNVTRQYRPPPSNLPYVPNLQIAILLWRLIQISCVHG